MSTRRTGVVFLRVVLDDGNVIERTFGVGDSASLICRYEEAHNVQPTANGSMLAGKKLINHSIRWTEAEKPHDDPTKTALLVQQDLEKLKNV